MSHLRQQMAHQAFREMLLPATSLCQFVSRLSQQTARAFVKQCFSDSLYHYFGRRRDPPVIFTLSR
nr:MAG TPA: hypothetical protein [Caudoviricetes sp.]